MKASAVHRALSALADLREGDSAMPDEVTSDVTALEECLHKYAKGGYDKPSEGDMAAKKASGRSDDEEAPSFQSAGEKARKRYQDSAKDEQSSDDES